MFYYTRTEPIIRGVSRGRCQNRVRLNQIVKNGSARTTIRGV